MVVLYGVTHDVVERVWLEADRVHEVHPSYEFLHELQKYPRGTRVGIEDFTPGEFRDVQRHLDALVAEYIIRNPSDPLPRIVPYHNHERSYWQKAYQHCLGLGHEVVFLENKDIGMELNKALVAHWAAHAQMKHGRRKYERQLPYDIRRTGAQEQIYRAHIQSRKIIEIDRDNAFLHAISANRVDVAIVGLGHSEYWMLQQEQIKQQHHLSFEEYGADKVTEQNNYFFDVHAQFWRNPSPPADALYSRRSLERILLFLETGTFSARQPDFVGTWDVDRPSRGYFELSIVHQDGSHVIGYIEDGIGTATFEGDLRDESFKFVKVYREQVEYRTTSDYVNTNASFEYELWFDGEGWCGTYETRGMRDAVYLTRSPRADPLDLARKHLVASMKKR